MNDYFYDEEYIIDDFSVSVKKGKGKKLSTTNKRLMKRVKGFKPSIPNLGKVVFYPWGMSAFIMK